MTPDQFRKIALALPEAVESAHMNHPDFRVRGKVFATLGYPDASWGMVKLRPDQQADFIVAEPDTFAPANGAWGRRGSTTVRLRVAQVRVVRIALHAAWENVAGRAPKSTRGEDLRK
jgi:hypothetical protein